MPRKKHTWREKLADDKGLPKVGKIEGKMSKRWGEGTMAIPAPHDVDALMKKVINTDQMSASGIRIKL